MRFSPLIYYQLIFLYLKLILLHDFSFFMSLTVFGSLFYSKYL